MKSTVSKKTEEYIKQLEQEEKTGKKSVPYHANPDAVDQLIIENNLLIVGISFFPQIDLIVIVLNNKRVLKRNLSEFKKLKSAPLSKLENYEISPMGVHWNEFDEDLSLRGFIKHEIACSDSPQIV